LPPVAARRLPPASPGAWPDDAELPADPALAFRSLANGLRLWHQPLCGRGFAVALVVGAGSLHEDEAEAGVAHFLEHLAFQGGGSPASRSLRRELENRGARLGRSLNAATGLEQTSYQLAAPTGGFDLVQRSFAALAEIAFSLQLDLALVEHERRVILEEIRQYEGPEKEAREHALRLLASGHLLSCRHPLGTAASVERLSAAGIAAFHRRWYRPDGAILLFAGDCETARLADLAAAAFEPWPNLPRPALQRSFPAASGPCTAAVLRDARRHGLADGEAGAEVELGFYSLLPLTRPRTCGEWRQRLAREASLWLFNRRLEASFGDGGRAACTAAALRHDRLTAEATLSLLRARAPAAAWRRALGQLCGKIAEAEGGFTAAEAESARQKLAAVPQGLTTKPGAEAAIARLLAAAAGWRPPMSPRQEAQLAAAAAPHLGNAELAAGLAQLAVGKQVLLLRLPAGRRAPSPAEIDRLREAPAAAAPRPQEAEELEPPFRSSGSIRERHSETRDRVSLILANNVRGHLLQRHFADRRVHFELNLRAGTLEEESGRLGITAAASLPLVHPQLASRRAAAFRRLIERNDLRYRAELGEDTLTLRISAPASAAEPALELLHHLVENAVPAPRTLASWRRAIGDPGGQTVAESLALQAMEMLGSGDPRFRPATRAELRGLRQAHVSARLAELRRAPIETAVVGAIAPEALYDPICRWLGSLSPRPLEKSLAPEITRLPSWTGPRESFRPVAGDPGLAGLLHGWRGPDWAELEERRRLHVLAFVLEKRLFARIRSRQGLAYSVNCTFSPSKACSGAALFGMSVLTSRIHLEACHHLLGATVAEAVSRGLTATERKAAIRYFQKRAREALRSPRYWAMQLADSHFRASRIGELPRLPQLLERITSEDLEATMARFLTADNQLIARCEGGST
jgi:zinc protease